MFAKAERENKMGCKNRNKKKLCDFFNKQEPRDRPHGCNKEGKCLALKHADPADVCCEYLSDSECERCGNDLNVYECECGQDEE